MPNRIIKESICKSGTIDQLSADEEVFFYRLLVNCDDFGRFSADANLLASLLYPRRRTLKAATVKKWLTALAKSGLVELYKNSEDVLLQVVTWDKHQRVRSKRSKYPSPADEGSEMLPSADIRCHPLSIDVNCPPNPIQSNPIRIQSESNLNPIQSPKSKANVIPDDFNEFWSAYPKKVGKKDAAKAWQKLKPDEALTKTILDGVKKWQESKQWAEDGGRFIPHPATFLNGERWNDECEPAKQTYIPKNYDTGGDFFDDDSGGDFI